MAQANVSGQSPRTGKRAHPPVSPRKDEAKTKAQTEAWVDRNRFALNRPPRSSRHPW